MRSSPPLAQLIDSAAARRALAIAVAVLAVANDTGCQTILGITDPVLAVDDGGGGSTGGGAGDSGTGGATGGSSATGGGGTTATGGVAGTGATGGSPTGGTGGTGGSGGNAGSAGAAGAGGGAFCAGTVFCTDFEDNVISDWVPTGGAWSVIFDPAGIHGRVYSGGGGSYVSNVQALTWTNQTVEARVHVTRFGGTSGSSYRAGIVARFAGGSSFYTLSIDADGYLRLLRGTSVPSGAVGTCGGVASQLSSVTGTWMTMKLQVSGSSTVQLSTWLDGVPIHDCQSTGTVVTSGSAGVITYGTGTVAEFDDVRVTQP